VTWLLWARFALLAALVGVLIALARAVWTARD
jgi:hypothetical protein